MRRTEREIDTAMRATELQRTPYRGSSTSENPIKANFAERPFQKLSEKGSSDAPKADWAGIRRPNWAEKYRFGDS